MMMRENLLRKERGWGLSYYEDLAGGSTIVDVLQEGGSPCTSSDGRKGVLLACNFSLDRRFLFHSLVVSRIFFLRVFCAAYFCSHFFFF